MVLSRLRNDAGMTIWLFQSVHIFVNCNYDVHYTVYFIDGKLGIYCTWVSTCNQQELVYSLIMKAIYSIFVLDKNYSIICARPLPLEPLVNNVCH